jgi:CubicO group peptidase (beta-lactamase class C family)
MNFTKPLFAILILSASALQPALADPKDFKANLPRLETALETLVKESGVPGAAVAIVKDGQVVYMKGFGVRQSGTNEAVDLETVFQLASCSKPMTSTAVASLASKHSLSFDDPVVKYLPEFRLKDDWITQHATFRDMLAHHSGLPGFAGDLLEELGFDRLTIIQQLQFLPQDYDFRVGYAYTNYGYTVGGEAAARAAGLSYEDMMEREIFKPLGMKSTSARFSDFERHPNHAHTHILKAGKASPTVRNADAQAPAGGVSSSIRDMSQWAKFHLDAGAYQGKQLIASEALEQTYRIHSLTKNNPGDFSGKGYYGMGWGVSYDDKGRYRLSHSGAFSKGARSVVNLIPQEKLGVVVLANAFPSGLPEGIAAGVVKLHDSGQVDLDLMRQVDGQVSKALSGFISAGLPTPAYTSAALPLKTYVGEYQHNYLGAAKVSMDGERLVLQLGKRKFALLPQSRDSFQAVILNSTAEIDPFLVTFLVEPSGKTSGFRQQGLDPIGTPYFSRK